MKPQTQAQPQQAPSVTTIDEVIANTPNWAAALEPQDFEDTRKLARSLLGSCAVPLVSRQRGAPKEPMSEADIVGIVMLGRSLGLGTMQALNGIYVVEGRVTLAALTMLALVRRSPVCEQFVFEATTTTSCTVIAKRRGDPKPTRITWTIEMAKSAGVLGRPPWSTYPQAMLRARAISDMCKMLFGDVLFGISGKEEMDDVASTDAAVESILTRVDMPTPPEEEKSTPPEEEKSVRNDIILRMYEAKTEHDLKLYASTIKVDNADRAAVAAAYKEALRNIRQRALGEMAQTYDQETGEVQPQQRTREPGED